MALWYRPNWFRGDGKIHVVHVWIIIIRVTVLSGICNIKYVSKSIPCWRCLWGKISECRLRDVVVFQIFSLILSGLNLPCSGRSDCQTYTRHFCPFITAETSSASLIPKRLSSVSGTEASFHPIGLSLNTGWPNFKVVDVGCTFPVYDIRRSG